MARIDALPSLEIIRGLKGILDFYVWRGLPCVRAWPKYRPARQTAASLAAALVFGAIVKSYSLLGNVPLEAYREDALDQPRTARDIMVTGVYGNLHEASMSDFLDLLVECRDFLSALTALLNALDSIDTDQIVVNVDESVLPTGAATAAKQLPDGHNVTVDNPSVPVTGTFWQATQPVSAAALPLPSGAATQATLATLSTEAKLETVRVLLASLDGKDFSTDTTLGNLLTELQAKADLTETQPVSAAALPLPAGAATFARQTSMLSRLTEIADLQDALESKALDRILIRGMDQLHSFAGVLCSTRTALISGANGFVRSHLVPAGLIWHVTHIAAADLTNATTAHDYAIEHDLSGYAFHWDVAAFATGVHSQYPCNLWLDPSDDIYVTFVGGQAGDSCLVRLIGEIMTLET